MLASPEVDEVNRKLSLVTCTTIVGLAGVGACRWVSAKHDGRPSRTKIHWEQFNEQPKMCLSYCRLYGCYPGSRGARRAPGPLDSGAGDQARTTGQGTFQSPETHSDQRGFQSPLPERSHSWFALFRGGQGPKAIENLKQWAKS